MLHLLHRRLISFAWSDRTCRPSFDVKRTLTHALVCGRAPRSFNRNCLLKFRQAKSGFEAHPETIWATFSLSKHFQANCSSSLLPNMKSFLNLFVALGFIFNRRGGKRRTTWCNLIVFSIKLRGVAALFSINLIIFSIYLRKNATFLSSDVFFCAFNSPKI